MARGKKPDATLVFDPPHPTPEQPQPSAEQENERRLLATLAELGGQRVSTDNLRFEGKELILPETMQVQDAINFLEDWREAQEETTTFSRTFRFRPWDGAHALQSAMKRVFGTAGIQRPTYTFFGKQNPRQMSIRIGPNDQTTQVPWGRIEVPIFKGTMFLGSMNDPDFGPLFALHIEAAKRFQPHAEALFQMVEEELKSNSIYRGKAFDAQEEPTFLDLERVDPEKVIYSADTIAQLEANLWSLLRYTTVMRERALPLKRAVLLHGPFGTGKTLAAFRTAQIATQNEWTFVYARPGDDSLETAIATARLYPPAVVFVEDVDVLAQVAEESKTDAVSKLLDTFDGLGAKGAEMVMVLTTNHPERIHKGMLRPGRLDSLIEIGPLDVEGVRRMIHACVSLDLLADDLDYETIHEAMTDYLPAFVKESIDRAMRYAIVREGADADGEVWQLSGPAIRLETSDFVQAAQGLRPQYDMMHGAREARDRPDLDSLLKRTVHEAVVDNLNRAEVHEPHGGGMAFEINVPNGVH